MAGKGKVLQLTGVRTGSTGWQIVAVATVGGLASAAAGSLAPDDVAEQLAAATRLTARWAVLWFLAAFAARPMHLVAGGIWTVILKRRRHVGLGFAAAHSVHPVAVALLFLHLGEWPSMVSLVGGGGVFAVIYAMALTSNDAAMHRLGRTWKRLHRAGIWVLWAVFTFAYAGRIVEPDTRLLGIAMSLLLVAAAVLRIPAVRRALARKG